MSLSDSISDYRKRKLSDPISNFLFNNKLKRLHDLRWTELILMGGNRCLGGETEIYDPVLGKSRRIDEIGGDSHVLAFNGSELVVAVAEKPFQKGSDRLYRVTLSDGQWFVASMAHRVLTPDGYRAISELRPGSALFQPQSSLEPAPLARALNARSLTEKARGFQSNYSACPHLDDGQLPFGRENGRGAFPLQGDALEHTSSMGGRQKDGPESKLGHTHSCQSGARLSSLYDLSQNEGHVADILFREFCKLYKSDGNQHQAGPQSMSASCLVEPIPESGQSDSLSCSTTASNTSNLTVISIAYERTDVKWDMTVPEYGSYLAGGVLHRNSGKTTYGAREAVGTALEKPGAVVWCVALDFVTSVRVQQFKISQFIPAGRARKQYRAIKGYIDQAVAISHGPGLPDSVIVFKSYESGAEKFQSDSVDLVWNDEEPPYEVYQEELMRLMDRNGRMITTMTSLNGYTEFIKETYGKWEKGLRPDLTVEFVETEDNLIENGGGLTRAAYERILEKIPEYDKKTRTKGIPSIRRGVVFKEWEDAPPFVIPRFNVPVEWTRYLVIDPHEATPTAIVMLAFSPKNTCYIYQALFEGGTVEQIARKIDQVEPIKNFRKKLMDHAANVGATVAGGIMGTNIAHRFSLAGITCEMTNSAIKDINSGIDAMRTRIGHITEDGKPGLVLFDDLVEPRQELKNHSFDDEGLSVRKKNKHFVDCVKYALNYGFKFEAPEPTEADMEPYYRMFNKVPEMSYARLEC